MGWQAGRGALQKATRAWMRSDEVGAARSVAGYKGKETEDKRKESKEMVLVSNLERLGPSAATKPKTVLRY